METELILFILFIAAILRGGVGFGQGALGTIAITSITGSPVDSIMITLPPLIISNAYIILQVDGTLDNKEIWYSVRGYAVGVFLGATVGTLIISSINPRVIEIIIGIMTVVYVIKKVASVGEDNEENVVRMNPRSRYRTLVRFIIGVFSGLLMGISNAATHITAYVDSVFKNRGNFIIGIAVVGMLMDLSRIVTASYAGLLETEGTLYISLIGLIPTIGGLYVGDKLRGLIPSTIIEYLVYITLLGLSVTLLI